MRVISLGWGVQSFTLAAMSALGELPPVDFAIHADTTWERSGTYEFRARWEPWLVAHGVEVETVKNENHRKSLLNDYHGIYIPAYTVDVASGTQGALRRQCTHDWKIAPMHYYIKLEGATASRPVEQWIGISKDEWHRAKDSDVRYIVHKFPLLDLGMTRADCIGWLQAHGLEVPGKSSCTFCPFHNGLAWQQMKRENGPDWRQAVEIDAAIRDKRPPYPLFVHRKCVPLDEAVVIPEDFGYTQLQLLASDDADAACDSGACFL